MFTGIIDSVATISRFARTPQALSIAVRPAIVPYKVSPGDSVAINGVCLTVESMSDNELFFTAVQTTISKSTIAGLKTGCRVNLERALTPETRMGGHFVLGHIDSTGKIASDVKVGGSVLRKILIPHKLKVLTAPGGSVAIDGVSLTIADSDNESITVSLVPYTLNNTILAMAKPGDTVNIECDVLARYLYNMYKGEKESLGRKNEDTADVKLLRKMETLGF